MNRLERRATARRSTRRAHAFTVVELMIGMTITALVLGAAAGFAAALNASWQSAHDAGRQQVAAAAGTTRLKRLLQPARHVGAVGPGSAEPGDAPAEAWAVVWRGDDFAADDLGDNIPPIEAGDGVAQYGEVVVLQYVPGGGALRLYEPVANGEMSRDQRRQAANPLGRQTLDGPDLYDQFKQLVASRQLDMMADPVSLIGSADPEGNGLRVTSAGFSRDDAGAGPGTALSYWVELGAATDEQGLPIGETRIVRGTVGLWQPSAPADDAADDAAAYAR